MLLGATGTAGQATLAALLERGHHVTCFVRAQGTAPHERPACFTSDDFAAAAFRFGDVTAHVMLMLASY